MSARLGLLAAYVLSVLLFFMGVLTLDGELLRAEKAALTATTAKERAEVIATVEKFNKIYQDFYASAGIPTLIDQFPATRDVKHRVFRDLGYLREANRVLVLDFANGHLVELSQSDVGEFEAIFSEEWNYLYQGAQDRKPVTATRGAGQRFRYRLSRRAGQLLVTDWDPVEPPTSGKTHGVVP